MAGTSEYKAIVAAEPGLSVPAISPNSPAAVRGFRELANNANHLADEAAQVRCKWVMPAGAAYQGLGPTVTMVADKWYELFTARFPVLLRHDGSPYRLRVRVGGASGSAGVTTTFRVDVGTLADVLWMTGETASYTTTSTTPAWLSGTKRLSVPASAAESTLEPIDSEDSAGNVVTAEWHVLAVSVHVKMATGGFSPSLHGLVVEEYVG